MKQLAFALLCSAVTASCAGTADDAKNALAGRYVGQSVDVFVAQFGPPQSTFKMHSGDTSYIWQLSNFTDIETHKYGGSARTLYCKVSLIADGKGTVKSLNTEDASNLVGESLCSQRLGIQRSS
jgi:hypothetical protein